jgi:hypothetical protein
MAPNFHIDFGVSHDFTGGTGLDAGYNYLPVFQNMADEWLNAIAPGPNAETGSVSMYAMSVAQNLAINYNGQPDGMSTVFVDNGTVIPASNTTMYAFTHYTKKYANDANMCSDSREIVEADIIYHPADGTHALALFIA